MTPDRVRDRMRASFEALFEESDDAFFESFCASYASAVPAWTVMVRGLLWSVKRRLFAVRQFFHTTQKKGSAHAGWRIASAEVLLGRVFSPISPHLR